MPLGELVLGAFLQVLFDRLAPRKLSIFPCDAEIRSELKQWKKKLLMIQAVLEAAEEKQLTNKAVKMWLDNLRDLAYDVEDILDEYATQVLERQLMNIDQPPNGITEYFSPLSPRAMISNRHMKSEIEEISGLLEDLCEQRDYLGLKEIAGGTSTAKYRRSTSTCVPTESAVYGREEDKNKILKMMSTCEELSDANFCVIPIVGMGGIGKTTIAREVYNDETMKDFLLKAWVCVSHDFDVLRISKAILESITRSPCSLTDLNAVQVELRDQVRDKRFLLVLDDVWSNDYGWWEILKSPFMAVATGSKIIVTTRIIDVALTMGHGECYNLKLLSDDDCWAIFKKHAFQTRGFHPQPTSEFIHTKVVEKCRGLPLAARTLGGLLRCKQKDGEWEDILNSKIWDLTNNNEIPAVLKLSYYHLPAHLKRCFAYCAIYPKGYEFTDKEFVLLWMAEGLIQPSKDNEQPEDTGGKYFQDLLSRSIFQQSSNDGSKFVMHDHVNDLAQWAAGETSFRLEDELRLNNEFENFKKVRYSSYTSEKYNGKKKFEIFHKFGNLRTFSQMILDNGSHFLTNIVISEMLPKFKKLRVLSLRECNIKELPDSIGDLRYLRYLNFSNTEITSLPNSTNLLFNLQVLILRSCSHIKKLPAMGNLINLRHLDIEGVNLMEMPLGMEKLKNLQTLSNFVVGRGTGSGLEVLKNLEFVRGKLCISGMESVTGVPEAMLSDKKKLEELLVRWKLDDEGIQSEEEKEKVIDMLRPHNNLKKLTIEGYGGTRFPNWVGGSSYSKMTDLKLEFCIKCTSLPSLGLLGSLKNLTISSMTEVEIIDSKFYGEGSLKSFRSLETLIFQALPKWQHWDPMEDNEFVKRFPRLRELSIVNCPKLSGRLPKHLPSLKKLGIHRCAQLAVSLYCLPSLETLVINECARLEVSFSTLPRLCKLELQGCKEMVCCGTPTNCESLSSMTLSNISRCENWLRQGFQKVEHLRIVCCEQLISLWQNEICSDKPPQGVYSLTSLRKLYIKNCSSLVSFPEADFLCTLLVISNCNSLKCLPDRLKFTHAQLEHLEIEDCHSLTCIVRGELPLSLKQLSVRNCKKLECMLDDKEKVGTSSSVMHRKKIDKTTISLLQYLSVTNCSSLKWLSTKGQLPTTLEHLDIDKCPNLGTLSSMGQLPALKNLKVTYCSKLTNLRPEGPLPESLEDLYVCDCRKLKLIAKRFHNNKALKNIHIQFCESLRSMPEGLHSLSSLHRILITDLPTLVSFTGELPNTIQEVSIERCKKLKVLPSSIHRLNSLKKLTICQCPSIVISSQEGLPTNLTSLAIGGLNIYKPLLEWGLHKLASLTSLWINEGTNAESFPIEGTLPPSLTELRIGGFPNLRSLFPKGFRNLTSLQYLTIIDCPNFSSFPKGDLLSSVVFLYTLGCPLLKDRCKKNGGEWPKIAHIPCISVWD